MEVEDEDGCRRKLDEKRKKRERATRGREIVLCNAGMQHQLQVGENRRNDLMPEHQKAQKTQKMQSIQDKRNIYRRKAWRQE